MGLVFQNISKKYGAVVAIKHAEMEIENGEVRAILGGNGSGKSTLAKALGGLISKNSGEIIFDGQSIDFKSPKEAKKNHVIMTSQELSLFGNLTVEENICICDVPLKGIFTDKKRIKEKSLEILEVMKLENIATKKVEDLAPNQQYMVELAKALVQEPKLLIIDEITSALYREDVEIVDDIIKDLKKKGCMVLFISHRMSELYAMCDSVTIMKNGETLGTYPMQEKTESELLSLMVGSKVETGRQHKNRQAKSEKDILIKAPHIKIPSYGTEESLEIRKGEIIGVAGLQGHGQTDLVNSLYGNLGEIKININGKEVSIHNSRQAVSNGFAFISGDRERDGTFQERNLAENLAAVKELVKHEKIGDSRSVLDSFNVKYDNPGQLITALSGGNQQKVVAAKALAQEMKVVIMDEPTKGVDVGAKAEIYAIMGDLAKKGYAIILISSEMPEILGMADRIIVMCNGRKTGELNRGEATQEGILELSMEKSTGKGTK